MYFPVVYGNDCFPYLNDSTESVSICSVFGILKPHWEIVKEEQDLQTFKYKKQVFYNSSLLLLLSGIYRALIYYKTHFCMKFYKGIVWCLNSILILKVTII